MRAIVGFAAETGDANGDVLFHARAKLKRKGCDFWWSTRSGGAAHSRWTTTTAGWWPLTDGVHAWARVEDADGKPYRRRDREARAGTGVNNRRPGAQPGRKGGRQGAAKLTSAGDML